MNNTTEPTKEQMYQWYVVEQKSFRQIMKIIGTKNNRKIPKLLKQYHIPIRHGSEAVKTQWKDHDRRKKQGEIFAKAHKGKPSPRRKKKEHYENKLISTGLKMLNLEYVNGYAVMEYKCISKGHEGVVHAKNAGIKGCPRCHYEEQGGKQRVEFHEVQRAFSESGLVLVDTEYKSFDEPLAYICPNHASEGIQYRSYGNVLRVGKCPHCKREDKQKRLGMSERDKAQTTLRKWREAVFKRDKYTCQCCGDNSGGNLNAHHIKNFSEHKHLRFDIDNGITLCENCHNPSVKGSFHYIYGTRHNNEHQLKEYIKSKSS